MNMKSLLPWICVLALLAGSGWLFSANRQLETRMGLLRQENEELKQLREEAEQAQTNQNAAAQELAQLRKDHAELLRLRNELQRLRDDKQKLSRDVQAAQTQAQSAEAQAQALRATAAQAQANPAPAPIPGQGMTPEQLQAFRNRYGVAPTTPEQAQVAACVGHLRLIEAAKQQWATANGKQSGALFTPADLAPYLPGNTLPACPGGGAYTLNPIGISPICSVPTHMATK